MSGVVDAEIESMIHDIKTRIQVLQGDNDRLAAENGRLHDCSMELDHARLELKTARHWNRETQGKVNALKAKLARVTEFVTQLRVRAETCNSLRLQPRIKGSEDAVALDIERMTLEHVAVALTLLLGEAL